MDDKNIAIANCEICKLGISRGVLYTVALLFAYLFTCLPGILIGAAVPFYIRHSYFIYTVALNNVKNLLYLLFLDCSATSQKCSIYKC